MRTDTRPSETALAPTRHWIDAAPTTRPRRHSASGAREPPADTTGHPTGGDARRDNTPRDNARRDHAYATPRVRYRCCGCGFEFAPALPRAAPCPRCGSIGGHEELGRAGGGHRGS